MEALRFRNGRDSLTGIGPIDSYALAEIYPYGARSIFGGGYGGVYGNTMFMRGPVGERWRTAMATERINWYNNTNLEMAKDPEKLENFSRRLEHQTILPKKLFFGAGQEELPDILNTDTALTANAIIYQGEKEGNPTAAIERVENFWMMGLSFLQDNKHVESFADAAVETQNFAAATRVVLACGNGWGACTEILDKIFIESAAKMDGFDGIKYNNFVYGILQEFNKISPDEDIHTFMRRNFAVGGLRIFGWNVFGVEDKGKEYIRLINLSNGKHKSAKTVAGAAGMPGRMPGMMPPGMMPPGMMPAYT